MSTPLPLLATKFHIPPAISTLTPRPQLLQTLNHGLRSNRRVTLLSAPAGYGKTTLLSYWAQHCQRAVAWYSLDEDDGDPARFLAYLITALRQVDGVAGGAEWADLAVLQPFSARAALPALLSAIEAAGRELVLVFDDYHLIQAAAVHELMIYLLDHQPLSMHLVIATRADPPLPLARLRARGCLTELRQSELRFTLEEAATFLNHTLQLGLAAEEITALEARTEGWIAGLRLAATSIQAHGDAHQFVQDFKGSHRYILDYLIEEVLQHQPTAVQAFLLETSILDRLTGPLCEAVTEQPGGQAMLLQLERANLFIVPCDDERLWYRYHRLFADLLQKRLGESRPDRVPALHRRASRWHETNGFLAEAVDHALATDDFERAAQLVERLAEATLMRSESATLLQWLTALPKAQVDARPGLCVYHAWLLLLGGSPLHEVEARLQPLAESSTPLALPLRALIATYRGQLAGAIALAQQALAQLPDTESLMRGLATLTLIAAYHTQGDLAASRQVLQSIEGKLQSGNVVLAVTALCYQGDLCRREGELRQAHSLYQQALAFATDQRGNRLPMAGRALMALGDIAREWNELESAQRQILEGIELAGRWSPASTLLAYYTLARIRQVGGDEDGVREALQAMRHIAVEFKATEVDDRLVDMAEARMQIARRELDGPRRWAERYGYAGPVDPLALEQDPDLVVRHLHKYEYPILARLWLADGCPNKVLALLEQALPGVEQLKRVGLMLEYEILIALAAQAAGQKDQAHRALKRALTLAEPDGFTRLFADEGQPLAHLLRELAVRGFNPDYLKRLLAAVSPGTPAAPHRPTLVEPLSDREVEVLRLIAEGLSNRDIAQRLVLSLPTIKWHTSNIYGKLNVKNRTEAVAKARNLGVLPRT